MQYNFNHPAHAEYHPNSIHGPTADPAKAYDFGEWDTKGSETYRGDVSPHAEDTDQAQATTLYREVMDDAARERLQNNVSGHVSAIHPSETDLLERVYAYWSAVDADLGAAIKSKVEAGERGNHKLND